MPNGDDYNDHLLALGMGNPAAPPPEKYDPLKARIIRNAAQAGVPPEVAEDFRHVITKIESGGRHLSGGSLLRSDMGAQGVSQVVPDKGSANIRTVGGRKYDLTDFDQNLQAGLKYFAEGGDDPVGRRLYYFGGPGARNYYQKHKAVPPGGEWATDKKTGKKYLRTSFRTYIDKTTPASGFAQSSPPPAESGSSAEPANYNELVNALGFDQEPIATVSESTKALAPVGRRAEGKFTPVSVLKPTGSIPEPPKVEGVVEKVTPPHTGRVGEIVSLGPTAEKSYREFIHKNVRPRKGASAQTVDAAFKDEANAKYFLTIQDALSQNPKATQKQQTNILARIGLDYLKDPDTKGKVLPNILHSAMLANRWHPDDYQQLPQNLRQQIHVQREQRRQQILGVKLSTNDAAWHFGMNPSEARRLSSKAIEVLESAVTEDQRKKSAGETIAPPPLRYQNEMRKKAGMVPLRFNRTLDENAPSPYYKPEAGDLPINPSRIEVEPRDFTFKGQSDDEIKAGIAREVAEEQARFTPKGRAPRLAGREVDAEVNARFERFRQERARKAEYARLGPSASAREPGIAERIGTAISSRAPGIASLDTPMGVKTDPLRGAASLGLADFSREVSPEEKALDPEAQAKADLAYGVGQFVPAVLPYMAAGKIAEIAIPAATKAGAVGRTAATFGGVAAAREGVKALQGKDVDLSEVALSTALGAATGGIAGLKPGVARQIVAFVAPQVAADAARGTPLPQAAQNAITNLLFGLHSGIAPKGVSAKRFGELREQLGGSRVTEIRDAFEEVGRNARQTESQRQGVQTEQPAEVQSKSLGVGANNPEMGAPKPIVGAAVSSRAGVIPETEATKQHQLKALTEGREELVMIPPNDSVPEVPKGFEVEKTAVGSFIFDPNKVARDVIQAKVENDTWHELLGHLEAKSPKTTSVVTARAPSGEEQKSSVVSPEQTEAQAAELKTRYPDATIEIGSEGQALKIIDERQRERSSPSPVEPSVENRKLESYDEMSTLSNNERFAYFAAREGDSNYARAMETGNGPITPLMERLEPAEVEFANRYFAEPDTAPPEPSVREGEKPLTPITSSTRPVLDAISQTGDKDAYIIAGDQRLKVQQSNYGMFGRATAGDIHLADRSEIAADLVTKVEDGKGNTLWEKPSPQVEAVKPEVGAKKEVTNESTAELVAGAKSTTSGAGAVAAPTPLPELPPVAKSEPAFITAARERLASEKTFKEAGGEKRGSGGPDTQPLIDHLLVHGWDAYQAGKVKFGEWSTEMKRRFGEDIEPHLKAAWAQLTGKADEAPEFNWSAREEGGEWKILNPKGEEVSRVSDRKVAEQIVKDMRESDVSPQGQSLVQAIRRMGGIESGIDSKGELSYFTNKESGSAGIINKSGRSAQDVARALAEEGYGLGDWAEVNPRIGTGYEINLNRFREAVQEEVSGQKKHYSTESQPDYEAEHRQRAQSEVDEHDADGTVSLLENEQSGVLYDKIASGKATPSEILEFRQHANNLGISGEAQDKLIASARETGVQEAGNAPAEKPVNAGNKGDTLKSTAAKREKVTEDREARDEAPIPKPERKSDETLLADAKAANAKDPTEPMRLVDQVLNGEKSLSDTEVVQVDLHRQGLKNKYDAVNKELDAATDAAKIGELSDKSDAMEREMRMSEEAHATSNTAIARALRAARITVDQDFRLLTMVSRAIKARGRALTSAERATIKDQHAKIEKLEADLVEANDRAAKNEATKAVGRIKADVAKENRRAGRGLRKQSLDSEAAELKSLIAQAWKRQKGGSSTVQPLMGLGKLDPEGVVTKLVVQLARNRLEANVGLRSEALVDEVHTLLKDAVDLSRRDVAEMISGYGKTFEMSQDKIDIKLRELKSIIASNLGKSDIIEKGIRPLRRGMQRDKPTQEVRQAMRELRDTLREHGMQVERSKGSPEEQQKSSLDAAKTQIRNRIEDLTKWIADGKRTIAKKTEIIPDAELRDLRAERDRLQTVFEAIKDPAADQKAIENAVQSVQKSINDLEAKIKSGNLAPKTRQGGPTSPELDTARAQQKALRSILNDLRNAAKPPPDAMEVEARKLLSANKALSTRMEKQIADLTRRMAQGDFSETVKRERAVYNKENLALEKQLNEIKRAYAKANYKATRGRFGMVTDELAKAANVPKTIKSMGDISAMLRQGGFFAISHPIQGLAKPTADMLRSFTEVGYENVNQMIRDSKNFELLKRMGVKFSGVEKDNLHQEEGFFGGGTIDVVGSGKYNPLRTVKEVKNFSERTFNAFLDSQRMHIGNQMIDGLLDPGIIARTLGAKARTIGQINKAAMGKDFTRIGDLINSGTGRGSLGKYDNAAPFLNIFMFSPRLLKSRVDLMMNMFKPVVLKNMDPAVRAQMIKDNVKFLAGTVAVMAAATAAGGTVNRDPDDADFLKIRFGKTTYDTLTGLQQPLRYIINMTRAATGGEEYPGKSAWEMTVGDGTHGGFLESKAAPLAGAVVEQLRGTDFTGRKRGVGERALDLVTPLPMKDFVDAMQKEGLLAGFVKATPSLTGVGVQTYNDIPEPKTTAERLAKKLGYHPDKQRTDEERTDEEIDKSRKLGELRQRSRKGEDVAAELQAAGATEKQTDAILAAKDTTQLQGLVKPLGMKEAFTVYDAATSEEKKDIRQILVDKYWRAADQGFPNKTKDEADEIKARAKKLGLVTGEPAKLPAKPTATPTPKSDYEQMRQLLGTP